MARDEGMSKTRSQSRAGVSESVPRHVGDDYKEIALDAVTILDSLRAVLPAETPDGPRLMVHCRPGNPADGASGWPVTVAKPWELDDRQNCYTVISAFNRAPVEGRDGRSRVKYARRISHHAYTWCLMIDDLGDGPGSKHSLATIDKLPPSLLIETSPRNYQAVYILSPVAENRKLVDHLIKQLIKKELLSDKDPGMRGVTRVMRLPLGINGKPTYHDPSGRPWRVKARIWEPTRTYTAQQFAQAFALSMEAPIERVSLPPTEAENDLFKATVEKLRYMKMFTSADGHSKVLGEWSPGDPMVSIKCPFSELHSPINGVKPTDGCGIRPYSMSDGKGPYIFCNHGHGTEHRDFKDYVKKINDDFLAQAEREMVGAALDRARENYAASETMREKEAAQQAQDWHESRNAFDGIAADHWPIRPGAKVQFKVGEGLRIGTWTNGRFTEDFGF